MSELVGDKLIHALWKVWQKSPPAPTPGGSRLFIRAVQFGDDCGWWDWELVGHVVDGHVNWVDDNDWSKVCTVERGDHAGSYENALFALQWCVSEGDGPSGERTLDWIDPTGEMQ